MGPREASPLRGPAAEPEPPPAMLRPRAEATPRGAAGPLHSARPILEFVKRNASFRTETDIMTYSPTLELYLSVEAAIRFEETLAVFDRITAGTAPDARALETAPLLSGWQRGTVPAHEPVLFGRVEGHPCLPGPRTIATSRLLALDPVLGWARTSSRWYRLGTERD